MDNKETVIDSTLGELASIEAYRVCFKALLASQPQSDEQALFTMLNCGQSFLKYVASFEAGAERAYAG